jgi:hypothetical protein
MAPNSVIAVGSTAHVLVSFLDRALAPRADGEPGIVIADGTPQTESG